MLTAKGVEALEHNAALAVLYGSDGTPKKSIYYSVSGETCTLRNELLHTEI